MQLNTNKDEYKKPTFTNFKNMPFSDFYKIKSLATSNNNPDLVKIILEDTGGTMFYPEAIWLSSNDQKTGKRKDNKRSHRLITDMIKIIGLGKDALTNKTDGGDNWTYYYDFADKTLGFLFACFRKKNSDDYAEQSGYSHKTAFSIETVFNSKIRTAYEIVNELESKEVNKRLEDLTEKREKELEKIKNENSSSYETTTDHGDLPPEDDDLPF